MRNWSLSLITLALPFAAACAEAVVPAELIGTWSTDATTHADRALRITPDSLFVGTGPGVIQAYRITGIQRYGWNGDGSIRIEYERQGLENALRLTLDADSALLRLANRPGMIWRRTGTAGP
jgi:hypothetical protein